MKKQERINMDLKKSFIVVFIGFVGFLSMAQADTIPEWFLPFSDTVYRQVQNSDQVLRLYTEIKQRAFQSFYLKKGTSHRETDVVSITNRILLGVKWTFWNKGGI
jgi:hypothetical protein